MPIRRVRPSDAAALRCFYDGLSPESRRARFLGWVGVSDGQSLTFCTPDHVHAEGFVALSDGPDDASAVIGHLCLEPAGPHQLELAVAVADAWHGRGVGRALMAAALAWATERGYDEILASCFADNWRVLRLLGEAVYPPRVNPAEAGVVNVSIPLHGPLPMPWSGLPAPTAHGRRAPGRALGRALGRAPSLSRPCRVVWRRTPPPVRGAGG